MKKYVVGVDEVGRGPIAGPVTVAALVIKDKKLLKGLQKLMIRSNTAKPPKKTLLKKTQKRKNTIL